MGEREGIAVLLVLARVGPLALSVGAVSSGFVPVAVALSLGIAVTCALLAVAGPAPAFSGLSALALAVLREACIGATFAIALGLALCAVGWALRLAHGARDPLAHGPLEVLYTLCATWSVIALGGHRAIVAGLAESYRDAALGVGALDARGFALGIVQLVSDALATALGFAAPLLLGMLLLELVLAFAARLLAPRGLPLTGLARPLLFTLIAALLLAPIAGRAPEAVRSAIGSARTLTRALAK